MDIKVVRGLPAHEYHAIRAASSTRLKELMRSPAHLRYMDENPKFGDALVIGDAFHTMVLESQDFTNRFVTGPDVDRRTKDGKAEWAAFAETVGTRKILTYDQNLMVTGMAKAVMSNTMAHELVLSRTETELTLFWRALGIACKSRIDGFNLNNRAAFDLKSCENANRDEFARSIANFKYHVQAAWYLDSLNAAGFPAETIVFIAVEKVAPYGVALYELDDDAIEEGRIQIAKHLPILANCEDRNDWPGYEAGIQSISLPRWSVKGEGVTL